MAVDEFVRSRPASGLRSAVAWYSGYRQVGVPAAVHRGLPSPFLTLIFTLDDPLDLAQHVDPRRPAGRYDALVGDLHTSPALVRHDGRQSGIQVAVDPLAARALFGLPAGELAGLDDAAAAVLGGSAVARIRERLVTATGWPARFAVLDDELSGRVRAADLPDLPAEVRYAWARLRRSGGRIPISALAAETGWSARHLQNRLRVETGLGPKQAARVIRFDHARRHWARHRATTVADVALTGGYADQSHFDREFRELAGCSPTVWWAEEFRNIQDGHWGPPADSNP